MKYGTKTMLNCIFDMGRKSKNSVCLIAFIGSLTLGAPTIAQSTEDDELEEVVVVGSVIRGTPIDASHAVTIVDRSTYENQGSPLVVDLLKNLGGSNGVTGERSGWYNSSLPGAVPESVSNVNLRGLGASRTLVLFNGKRQTYLPARLVGGRFVDLSVLPSVAIERIEVLKEGASAIYGSDAIGGIANFVTRRSFSGFETSVSLDSFDSANDMVVNAIYGGSIGDMGDFAISFEHERRAELEAEDRDWALIPLVDPWRAAWSSVGSPGYFWFPTGIDTATTPRAEVITALREVQWSGKVDPYCNELNGYPEHPAVDPFYCIFNYQPFDNIIEELQFSKVFAELNGDWGETSSYHLEALWAHSVMPKWQTQPSHPPFPLLHRGVLEIGPNHPNRMAFCADEDYSATFRQECQSGENWYFRGRPFGNGYVARTAERVSTTWRFAGAVDGSLEIPEGKTTFFELAFAVSGSQGNVPIPAILTERLFLAFRGYGGPNCGVGVVADTSLGPGMRVADTNKAPGTDGCLYLNPFSSAMSHSALPGAEFYDQQNPVYDPSQANAPELIDWMNSVSDIDNSTSLLVLDATISGDLISDKLSYATGYQFRSFTAEGEPNEHGNLSLNPCPVLRDQSCLTGNFGAFTFINAYNPYDSEQQVHRVFGEFAYVLSDQINAQIALNFEQYDEASSLDPKIAVRWEINDTLTLRSTLQTTFRTPSVDDLLEGVPLTVTNYVSQVGAWIPVDLYGDESLDPERASTFNVGVIASLANGVNVTLDYWSYDFQDVIGSIPHDDVDELYADPSTRSHVQQFIYCASGRSDTLDDPCDARSITRVEVPLVNWPGVETSGFDWHVSAGFPFLVGVMQAGFSGTYTLNYELKPLHFADQIIRPGVDAAGKLNFGNPLLVPIPQWKSQAYVTLSFWNKTTVTTYVNHISSYSDDASHDGYGGVPVSNFEIEGFTTLDVTAQRFLEPLGINIAFSILNLTDEAPPFANVEFAYDGMTHNPKGRRIKLSLSYRH
ncbi:MAG: TonB-dependent receptor [Gammaproteobacteria bacterium]|nr:TonB-dependent receptor [Gammaproteobacteria bacterium]MYF38560.1 TonB-dependent receptor [Gammaproteobacteria bacterium]